MKDVFLPVNWYTDSFRCMVFPRFIGDCEITNVAMSLETVEITLENGGARPSIHAIDPVNASTFKLVFQDPEYFAFSSLHLQNVVSDIHVFQNDELALGQQLDWFSHVAMLDELRDMRFELFVVIKTVTSGASVIAARELRIYESRHGKWTAE